MIEDRNRARADGLVHQLLDAATPQVPSIVVGLGPYRRWADPMVRQAIEESTTPPRPRLHARLAMLPMDASQIEPLLAAMLEADPESFLVIREALQPHRTRLIPLLWRVADSSQHAAFRAAVALASYDPEDRRWVDHAGTVARQLVGQPSLLVPAWVTMLEPVRRHLAPEVARLLGDAGEDRPLVASILADYARDRRELIATAIGDAGPAEFDILLTAAWRDRPGAADAVDAALTALIESYRTDPRDAMAARIANTGIALLRLGRPNRVWPLLVTRPDPGIRSFLIDRIATLRTPPAILADRLPHESDSSARAALLLALGHYGVDQAHADFRSSVAEHVLATFRDDPDPGVHAAAGRLLRSWGLADRARSLEASLATGRVEGKRRWYLTNQGQTMVLLPGRDEFQMGSPDDEKWRRNNEGRMVVRVAPLDVATTEVTVGQFRTFLDERPEVRGRYGDFEHADPRLPQTRVTWYDAAAYCNWLSERDGLPRDQWCYEPNEEGKYEAGMRIVADFAARRGYRLPIESEWEYACRPARSRAARGVPRMASSPGMRGAWSTRRTARCRRGRCCPTISAYSTCTATYTSGARIATRTREEMSGRARTS